MHEALPERTEATAKACVHAAIRVHRALGPGLLKSAYEVCLGYELSRMGVCAQRQLALPIRYDDVELEAGYRLDLVADDSVIVEIKVVEGLAAIHEAQMLTYLKLSGLRLGLLMNFNVVLLKQGLKRIVL